MAEVLVLNAANATLLHDNNLLGNRAKAIHIQNLGPTVIWVLPNIGLPTSADVIAGGVCIPAKAGVDIASLRFDNANTELYAACTVDQVAAAGTRVITV